MTDVSLDGSYTVSQIKKAFLILSASGQMESFEKMCTDRGLKIRISESDRNFISEELNKIIGALIKENMDTNKNYVAHQGCPC